jgi:hypothetical protein
VLRALLAALGDGTLEDGVGGVTTQVTAPRGGGGSGPPFPLVFSVVFGIDVAPAARARALQQGSGSGAAAAEALAEAAAAAVDALRNNGRLLAALAASGVAGDLGYDSADALLASAVVGVAVAEPAPPPSGTPGSSTPTPSAVPAPGAGAAATTVEDPALAGSRAATGVLGALLGAVLLGAAYVWRTRLRRTTKVGPQGEEPAPAQQGAEKGAQPEGEVPPPPSGPPPPNAASNALSKVMQPLSATAQPPLPETEALINFPWKGAL